MTKKQKREQELVNELQTKHGYFLLRTKRPSERTHTGFRRKGKKMEFYDAVSMQLVVPATSLVGQEMQKFYADLDKKQKSKRSVS